MTRPERLLLLAFFAAVLSVLGGWEPTAVAIGGVAGAGAGVVATGRVRRLSDRMDARLGPDDSAPPAGFALRRPAVRAGTHVVVLGGLLVTTGVLPFVGDELFAGTAAAATAFPLVVTASRLRR
jgi:hypothetical protein